MPSAATLRARIESSLGEHLSSTLLLRERAAPLTVSTGLAALDALTGGLPRGALSEIAGPASSGRTGVMLAALAQATRRQEVCALVDASDSFDPASAAAAGVDLERLLWVRCSERASLPSHKDHPPRAALGPPRTSVEGDGPAAARRWLWHGGARSWRYSRRKCAARAAHLVVSFSPRGGTHRDRAVAHRTGALRQDLRFPGRAIGTRGGMRPRCRGSSQRAVQRKAGKLCRSERLWHSREQCREPCRVIARNAIAGRSGALVQSPARHGGALDVGPGADATQTSAASQRQF